MVLVRQTPLSDDARVVLEKLVAAQQSYPAQTVFYCYKNGYITRPDPYVEHVGLVGDSLDVELRQLDELAQHGYLRLLRPAVRLAWDAQTCGNRIRYQLRDTGFREFPFELTPNGLAAERRGRM